MAGTDLTTFFGGHKLPSRDKLAESLAGFAATKSSIMGKALLRLTKQGIWVFGVDNDELEIGTHLIVNPGSLASGYVAWWLGKVEDEIMQPLSMGPVDPNKLGPVNSGTIPPGKKEKSGKGWEAQSSVDMITQGDVPVTLCYKSSSLGGMKCLLTLAGDIVVGLSEDQRRVYPIVEVGVDSYQHKEYGEVFTPQLPIVGWLDEKGEPVVDQAKLAGKKNLI